MRVTINRRFVCLRALRRSNGQRFINGAFLHRRISRLIRRVTTADRRRTGSVNVYRCAIHRLSVVLETFLRYSATGRDGCLILTLLFFGLQNCLGQLRNVVRNYCLV